MQHPSPAPTPEHPLQAFMNDLARAISETCKAHGLKDPFVIEKVLNKADSAIIEKTVQLILERERARELLRGQEQRERNVAAGEHSHRAAVAEAPVAYSAKAPASSAVYELPAQRQPAADQRQAAQVDPDTGSDAAQETDGHVSKEFDFARKALIVGIPKNWYKATFYKKPHTYTVEGLRPGETHPITLRRDDNGVVYAKPEQIKNLVEQNLSRRLAPALSM